MISPRISGGAICLGCRLRLLRQSTQPLRASSRIFQIQHPSLRCFASESPARACDQNQLAEGQDQTLDSEEKSQDGKLENKEKEFGVKRVDMRKRRLSRNRILTEDAQNLASDMLGKPASVIVMRDGGLYQKKDRPPAPVGPDNEANAQPINIEALLNSQREPPKPQEVRKNIDSLRPSTETALSEREFRKLQALLTDGFLSAQLHEYLEYHKQNGQPSTPAFKYDWIKEITPWVPLANQSSVAEGTDPSLHGYITDSTTAKEKLAIRIMRECWGLSIVDLDAGLGETKIKIRNFEFLLLMRGTQRWLTVMGKIWLDAGEKIEAFRSKKTLRLVTTKTKAATLIKDLNETLKQVTTKSFSVHLIAHKPIDEAVLEEVGRITNTHVRKPPGSEQLCVTWIELKKRAAKGLVGLEDLGDTVLRLLLTAYNPQPSTTTSLHVADQDDVTAGRFITNTMDKEKLGWKDRMGQWARYALPLIPGGNTSAAERPLGKLQFPVERETAEPESDESNEFSCETQLSIYPMNWAEDLKVSTKAAFGHLLHANDTSTSPPPLPDLLTANYPRVFASAIPHPLHLAKLGASDDGPANTLIQAKTTIVIRFWPTPIRGAEIEIHKKRSKRTTKNWDATPPAPLLELRLATSGGEVKGVESLRAIKQTLITDVMLPTSLVDLRYMQAQHAVLEGDPAKLATWKPLADFLEPARLDVVRGKFEVPPRQNFPIPRRLFNNRIDWDPFATTDMDELVDTSYTFVGLEIHHSVSMPYEGFKLTYTSISGERGDGRNAEVSLEPGLKSKVSVAEGTRKLHDDFLAACQKFATTDTLWSGYLASRREF
ncbi:hypothetical protein M434DRAFT_401574 [Hypoxylon sp. CO27-5]|nr:hypothetical protein M434DRAFT_401574 [Hypoxylon sp. CO27-5]